MTEQSPAGAQIGSHFTCFLCITEQINSLFYKLQKTLFRAFSRAVISCFNEAVSLMKVL